MVCDQGGRKKKKMCSDLSRMYPGRKEISGGKKKTI